MEGNIVYVDFATRQAARKAAESEAMAAAQDAELMVFVPRHARIQGVANVPAAASPVREAPVRAAAPVSKGLGQNLALLNSGDGQMVDAYRVIGEESTKLQDSIAQMRAQSQRMTAAVNQMTTGLREFQAWIDTRRQL